jgi:hypothetical protein
MSTRHFAFYSISIFYKKSAPQLTEFWLTIDLFFSLFYSYILSHSEIFLLPLIVLHIYPMDVRAFLHSVIFHRIEKSANANFQYQILNLIKLCSDSFWSKYILPCVTTQHSWPLWDSPRLTLAAKTRPNQTALCLFIERTAVISFMLV